MPETRFVLLDGLRGVAAFGVVGYHLGPLENWNGIQSFVDFFFVLSGFVLAPAILSFDKKSGKKFLATRIIRLYPMLIPVFFTLILVRNVPRIAQAVGGFPSTTPFRFLGSFLLLQIFWAATISLNVPLWSLSAEFFTNLIATVYPSKQRFSIIVSFGLILETAGIFINHRYSLGWGLIRYSIGIGRALVGFYLGIILRNYLRLKVYKGSFLTLFIILITFSINMFLINASNFFIIFAAPICFLLIREVASFEESGIPISILSICSYMGRISYGVYVWHAVIGKLAIPEFVWKYSPHDLHIIPKRFFYPALTVIILVLVTEVSIRLVETPMRRIAKSHFQIFREN